MFFLVKSIERFHCIGADDNGAFASGVTGFDGCITGFGCCITGFDCCENGLGNIGFEACTAFCTCTADIWVTGCLSLSLEKLEGGSDATGFGGSDTDGVDTGGVGTGVGVGVMGAFGVIGVCVSFIISINIK